MEEKMYDQLLRTLQALGGKASNKVLMARMEVDATTYVAMREAAKADGVISLGRGRGGSVKLCNQS